MDRLGQVRLWFAIGALCCCAADSGGAEPSRPTATSLMIGPGRALVRETHAVNFSRREATLLLDVPPETDRSSLAVVDGSGVVQLAEIRWLAAEQGPAFSGSIEWPPKPNRASVVRGLRVLCTLRSDVAREQAVDVLYTVSNLSWRAHYEVNIRGDISNQLEPLSLDLEARYLISNGLSRPLQSTALLLMGPDRVVADPPPRPGFLALDPDSPLADRWRRAKPRPEVPQGYRVERPVVLPAGQETSIRFAMAHRVPTERSYELDSERVPVGFAPAWKPLRQILSFRNDRRAGLGFPLPPGTALITAGAGRAGARQEALLNHTTAGGVIRMDMGDAAGVIGARRSLGRQVSSTGLPEETIELSVANNLPSAVRVTIREKPPVPLAWDVIRSSRKYDLLAQRLHYELEVKARSEEVISYTVRLTEPEE